HVPSAIPTISENTVIPGNGGISPAERSQRCKEIFDPYHREISSYLDNREAKGLETVLISIHSFTPVFKSVPRPWDIGLLYNRDDRLAGPIHEALEAMGDLVVGDNEPYAVSDETDYTIPVHGEGRGIHHMMFEIRQDLIAEESGQDLWSQRLERVLTEACKAVLKGPQRNRTGPAF
ncbi:MAG: N-formylglutamate amidohydrolase, partial [Kiloniellales bacterium]|nr:N-formylglutamate amidohydrolase [Kiloniellales bacterium]